MSALSDQLPRSRSSPTSARASGGNALNRSGSLQVAGGLGLAGVLLGLSILIFSCAGFDAALYFSPAVIALGIASAIVTLFSTRPLPDSAILAALFQSLLAILGGVLELGVCLHWPVLFSQS